MAKSKLAKYRKNRQRKANPENGETIELATNIGAGFAGYAATRLLGRIAFSQAVKRFPNGSSYIHLAASAASAAGVYFGTKHVDKASDYHEAAAIGAGIALLQTAIQTFVPKFGWIVSDVNADQYEGKEARTLPSANLNALRAPDQQALPEATGDFSLEELLAEDDSIEAVPIGQAPPSEEALAVDIDPQALDFDDFADVEHHNGMMN